MIILLAPALVLARVFVLDLQGVFPGCSRYTRPKAAIFSARSLSSMFAALAACCGRHLGVAGAASRPGTCASGRRESPSRSCSRWEVIWLLRVTIPATPPRKLQSGPPLLPGLTVQSVTMNASLSSVAGRVLTTPLVKVSVIFWLITPGQPMAQTSSPIFNSLAINGMGASFLPAGNSTFKMAMSPDSIVGDQFGRIHVRLAVQPHLDLLGAIESRGGWSAGNCLRRCSSPSRNRRAS